MAKNKITEFKPNYTKDEFKPEYLKDPTPPEPTPFFQDLNFDHRYLRNRMETITAVVQGTAGATATNYSIFWIAPYDCIIDSIREVHSVLGTDGGAVTLDVEKLTGTQASGAGTDILASTIDLKGTIDTVVQGTLSSTISTLQVAENDRLGLVLAGTPTSVANVVVTLQVIY